jgi:L-amino acid N-acyltransferase YncA
VSSGADVLVRDAEPADLPAIFEIYNHEVLNSTATFDTEPRELGRHDEWLTGRNPARHPVLVADVEGDVVGWASVGQWSPRRAYDRTAEESVYVHRDRRGQGIGRVLLEAAIARGRAAGLGVLIARIAEANPVSVGLHESFGFRHIGTQRRCGEKFGRVLDVELMELQLDA